MRVVLPNTYDNDKNLVFACDSEWLSNFTSSPSPSPIPSPLARQTSQSLSELSSKQVNTETIRKHVEKMAVVPENHSVQVHNVQSSPLLCLICNDSLFFNVRLLSGGVVINQDKDFTPQVEDFDILREISEDNFNLRDKRVLFQVPPKGCANLCVEMDYDGVFEGRVHLSRHKYVEEHITLYNRESLTEKQRISLRLSFGHLFHFYLSPGKLKLLLSICSPHTYSNDCIFFFNVEMEDEFLLGSWD